ncbi:MAG: hypothetical protein U1E21_00885 [Reyranellaceae bacterium]
MSVFWRDLAKAAGTVLADMLPTLRAAFIPIAGLAGGVAILFAAYGLLPWLVSLLL